jgi:Zn-dependent protease with chaperone function
VAGEPDYLAELIDRTWRIAWGTAPLVLLAALALRVRRWRPAVVHALALGTALAMLLPLVAPLRRHVFELPAAGGPVFDVSPSFAWLEKFPAPWWLAVIPGLFAAAMHFMRSLAFRSRVAQAQDVPADVQQVVGRFARELGLRQPPRTVWWDASPMALWSRRRCVLLLPRALWSTWNGREQRAVLLHELAHLRRRDGLTQIAALLVTIIYWWNPLAWWLRAVVHEAAERSCDRWATARSDADTRIVYAHLLLSLASRRPACGTIAGVDAASAGKRRLEARLRTLLNEARAPSAPVRVTFTAIGGLLFGAFSTVGQLGAFEKRYHFTSPEEVHAFLQQEPDARVRRKAVDAVGNHARGMPWAPAVLLRSFPNESSVSVRYEIVDAFGRLGGSSDPRPLQQLARGDVSGRVRRRAQELMQP